MATFHKLKKKKLDMQSQILGWVIEGQPLPEIIWCTHLDGGYQDPIYFLDLISLVVKILIAFYL